jgi:hypothetical protein
MAMSAVSSARTPGVLEDDDLARSGRADVDMVGARAEIGDQLQVRAGGGDHLGVDPVGDGRHQHIGAGRQRPSARLYPSGDHQG